MVAAALAFTIRGAAFGQEVGRTERLPPQWDSVAFGGSRLRGFLKWLRSARCPYRKPALPPKVDWKDLGKYDRKYPLAHVTSPYQLAAPPGATYAWPTPANPPS